MSSTFAALDAPLSVYLRGDSFKMGEVHAVPILTSAGSHMVDRLFAVIQYRAVYLLVDPDMGKRS